MFSFLRKHASVIKRVIAVCIGISGTVPQGIAGALGYNVFEAFFWGLIVSLMFFLLLVIVMGLEEL